MSSGGIQVEICIDSVASAQIAAAAGADRVELCDNLREGGTTPSAGMISAVRQNVDLGLHVMVRPRGGDFLYDAAEIEAMRYDALVAKELGADGVVFGVLNADGRVNADATAYLLETARPLEVTFHRAIDMSLDPSEALETLIALGVDRVLTSGQAASALAGMDVIAALVRQAAGRVRVVPGGGIERRNLRVILERTYSAEVHLAPTMTVASQMRHRNLRCFMGEGEDDVEYKRVVVDERILREMMSELALLQPDAP